MLEHTVVGDKTPRDIFEQVISDLWVKLQVEGNLSCGDIATIAHESFDKIINFKTAENEKSEQ